MANDSSGTIRVHGGGAQPHLVQLQAQPSGAQVAVEVSVTGPRHQWSGSASLDAERWSAFQSRLQEVRKHHAAVTRSALPDVGGAEVSIGTLAYTTVGGATDLAYLTAEATIDLVGELGGPTAAILFPERGFAFGNADDTIDESGLNTSFHDTIPDAPQPAANRAPHED